MSREDAQNMARDAQDMGMQASFRRYAKARADRPLLITTDKELFMTCATAIKMQRWQHWNSA